jgi:hypothetical protein
LSILCIDRETANQDQLAAKSGTWRRTFMKNLTTRYMMRAVQYGTLVLISGASLLNLTVFQRQCLILVVLVWANIFFLFQCLLGQQA